MAANMIPLTRAGQRRRELLLEAALQLFLERGYDGTSTTEIHRYGGGSKDTMYQYFPDGKQQIFREAFERILPPELAPAFKGLPLSALLNAFDAAQRIAQAPALAPSIVQLATHLYKITQPHGAACSCDSCTRTRHRRIMNGEA